MGRLSVDLGWWSNLADVEALLEGFVSEGKLRHLTPHECERFGVSFAYSLV